jgi:ribonucleoside-diphosphate reductase alpha chain
MDTIATMTSIALQYGVPPQALVDKFSHTRFEPSGFTNNREIPIAKSITDYVFRYLGNRFLHNELELPEGSARSPGGGEVEGGSGLVMAPVGIVAGGSGASAAPLESSFVNQADAPSCPDCGAIMVRSGSCYKCPNCGGTSGCS